MTGLQAMSTAGTGGCVTSSCSGGMYGRAGRWPSGAFGWPVRRTAQLCGYSSALDHGLVMGLQKSPATEPCSGPAPSVLHQCGGRESLTRWECFRRVISHLLSHPIPSSLLLLHHIHAIRILVQHYPIPFSCYSSHAIFTISFLFIPPRPIKFMLSPPVQYLSTPVPSHPPIPFMLSRSVP